MDNHQAERRTAFLSYNADDEAFATELAARLEANGVGVWYAKRDLEPGHPWMGRVSEILTTAHCAVILLGATGRGPWQDREIVGALDRQTGEVEFRVIPIILPGAEVDDVLPKGALLRSNTWVRFAGADDESAIQALVSAIRTDDGGIAHARSRPLVRRTPRRSLRGIAFLVVAVLGVGAISVVFGHDGARVAALDAEIRYRLTHADDLVGIGLASGDLPKAMVDAFSYLSGENVLQFADTPLVRLLSDLSVEAYFWERRQVRRALDVALRMAEVQADLADGPLDTTSPAYVATRTLFADTLWPTMLAFPRWNGEGANGGS